MKIRKSFLYFFLSLFILSLLAFALFPQPLLTFFTKWALQTYVASHGNHVLHYDKLYWDSQQLVLVHPHLEHTTNSFKAKHIALTFHWDRGLLPPYFDVKIDSPIFTLVDLDPQHLSHLKKTIKTQEQWLISNSDFHITQGQLQWSFQNEEQMHDVCFEVNSDSLHHLTFLKVSFDPNEHPDRIFTLSTLKSDEQIEVYGDCQAVPFSALPILQPFFPFSFFGKTELAGNLFGHFKALFSSTNSPHLEGKFIIPSIHMEDPSSLWTGDLQDVSITISPTYSPQKDKKKSSHSKQSIWDDITLLMQAKRANISLKDAAYSFSCIQSQLHPTQEAFFLEGTAYCAQPQQDPSSPFEFTLAIPTPFHPSFPAHLFTISHLSLKDFIQLSSFNPSLSVMEGFCNCKGIWDPPFLSVNYHLEHAAIENEFYRLEIPLQEKVIDPDEFEGFYQLNMKNGEQEGIYTLEKCSYTHKKSGLCSENIHAKLVLKDSQFSCENLEGTCEGVYFSGKLESFDKHSVLSLPILSGSIANFGKFLAYFYPLSSFWKNFPLEGEFTTKGQGGVFRFQYPHFTLIQATLEGYFHQGTLLSVSPDLSLQGMELDIACDTEKKFLHLNNIQGNVCIGKSPQIQEILLTGDAVNVQDQHGMHMQFDLHLLEGKEDVARLKGNLEEKEEHNYFLTMEYPHTHILHLYPQCWTCEFDSHFSLHRLSLFSHFHLPSTWNHLYRFQMHGLAGLSPLLIQKLLQFQLQEGKGIVTVEHFPDGTSQFELQLNDVQEKTSLALHKGYLKGEIRGQKGFIETLKWNDWTAYAEIEQKEDRWYFPFVGLTLEHACSVGLKGNFFPTTGRLESSLNFCRIPLEKAKTWPHIPSFMKNWNIAGTLHTTGKLTCHCFEPSIWDHLHLDLHHHLENFSSSLPYVTCHPTFKMGYTPSEKFFLKDMQFLFAHPHHPTERYKIYLLKHVGCQLEDQDLLLLGECEESGIASLLKGKIQWPEGKKGECHFQGVSHSDAITFQWDSSFNNKDKLFSLKGEFEGATIDFNAQKKHRPLDPNSGSSLTGTLTFDAQHPPFFIPLAWLALIQKFNMEGTYTLKGLFRLKSIQEWDFEGKCLGKMGRIQDIPFQELEANLSYQADQIEMPQLSIESPIAKVKGEHMFFQWRRQQQDWEFSIPHLVMKQFKPQLLDLTAFSWLGPLTTWPCFIIKRLELCHFSGQTSSTADWKLEGNVHFFNSDRSLCACCLSMKGIEDIPCPSSFLYPVTGMLYFHFKDKRLYFTQLKDVYSEGRATKFTLTKKEESCWIDTEGNLSFDVRVKQCKSMFKLAQSFTLSIQGTLENPQYTLQKGNKSQ